MFPSKQGNASGTVTEDAALAFDNKDSRGPARERAVSASGARDHRLEKMFQEACSNAPPKFPSLLRELHVLGL